MRSSFIMWDVSFNWDLENQLDKKWKSVYIFFWKEEATEAITLN